MLESHCRRLIPAALAIALIATFIPAALAEPDAECNGQLNIRYISGFPYGVDGDVYRVEIGL